MQLTYIYPNVTAACDMTYPCRVDGEQVEVIIRDGMVIHFSYPRGQTVLASGTDAEAWIRANLRRDDVERALQNVPWNWRDGCEPRRRSAIDTIATRTDGTRQNGRQAKGTIDGVN